MIIKINTLSQIPLYLQLRNQIVKGIGKGELTEGESLPTVRQMAADLGINTMTVSKSYQLLKNEGFLYTDRRLGSIVHIPENEEPSSLFHEKLEDELELLSAEAGSAECTWKIFSVFAAKYLWKWRWLWNDALLDSCDHGPDHGRHHLGGLWKFGNVSGRDAPWRSSAGVCCIPPACSSAD